MPGKPFHIITIANDLAQYAEMRRSFEAAGFTDDVARYTLYDNSHANVAEPYDVLRGIDAAGPEPYAMVCHQDVRLDLGHHAAHLLARLAELTRRHPRWVVAGNAGSNAIGHWVLHLDDPRGRHRVANLPTEVRSLDENLLVVRRGRGPMASPALSGFHLYGTDACLTAASRGGRSYVIDFLLTHLSGGNPDSPGFRDAERRLVAAWKPRLIMAMVRTTCTDLRISRWRWLERLIAGRWTTRVLRRTKLGLVFMPFTTPVVPAGANAAES